MSTSATRAKAKWNTANYVQIKVSVYPEIANAFRAACSAAGVSMASELSRFMAEYSATPKTRKKPAADPLSTRKKRRIIVQSMFSQLEDIRDVEEQSLDNTPENLRNSERFEETSEIVERLNEAVEILGEIY